MIAVDIARLDGQTVLVRSLRDRRNPPTAVRGTIRVLTTADQARSAQVEIVLQYPQMFTEPARQRIIPLDEQGVARLLESEHNGAFEFAIDDTLD